MLWCFGDPMLASSPREVVASSGGSNLRQGSSLIDWLWGCNSCYDNTRGQNQYIEYSMSYSTAFIAPVTAVTKPRLSDWPRVLAGFQIGFRCVPGGFRVNSS